MTGRKSLKQVAVHLRLSYKRQLKIGGDDHLKNNNKSVPAQLGHLATGLAKIIAEMDEHKANNDQKIAKKKEKY